MTSTTKLLNTHGSNGRGKETAHKPSGPGGGQFTSGPGGGGGSSQSSGVKPSKNTSGPDKSGSVAQRVERAKASQTTVVGKDIQRYSEEHNEPQLAKALGGLSYKDNEPVDVVTHSEGSTTVDHGIELKTLISNKAAKLTMKGSALAKKRTWARKNKATFHTVVFDDQAVFNANGKGKHDESKRVIYYRRGAGSFRVSKMHVCKDLSELKTLIHTKTNKLPPGAK